jgi:hypothetical protein
MTIATEIKVATTGQTSQMRALSTTQGTEQTSADGTTASFRSGWQSLLASLGTDTGSLEQKEVGTSKTQASTQNSQADATETTSSIYPVGTASSGRSGNTTGSSIVSAIAALSQARSRIADSKTAAGVAQQTATGQTEKGAATNSSAESAKAAKSASSGKAAKLKSTSTDQAVDQASVQPDAITQVITPIATTAADQNAILPGISVLGTLKSDASAAVAQVSTDINAQNAISLNTLSSGPLVNFTSNRSTLSASNQDTSTGSAAVSKVDTEAPQSQILPDTAVSSIKATTSSGQFLIQEDSSTVIANNMASTDEKSTVLTGTQVQAGSKFSTLPQGNDQTKIVSSDAKTIAATVSSAQSTGSAEVAGTAASQSSESTSSTPAIAGKQSMTGNARTTAQSTVRQVRAVSASVSVQHGNQVLDVQSTGLAQSSSVLSGDPAAVREAVGTSGINDAGSSSTITSDTGISTRETFAALDADPTSGTPTWIHTGTHRAEAGFQDPALGWIGVRADVSGGTVHASLVSGSTDAAQALGDHLVGLNTYLAEHHTAVEPVTLAAPEGRTTGFSMDQSMSQNQNQGTGQGAGHDSSAGQQFNSQAAAPTSTSAISRVSAGVVDATSQTTVMGSTHISVMA